LPERGERFGRENNCLETGYGYLHVPRSAKVIGGGNTPAIEDFAAVFEVDDPNTALGDLADELDPTGPDRGDGVARVTTENTPRGKVWSLTADVGGGGGACAAWTTPGGRYLIVTTHSD
jgi:hypothetical protein